jgi:hypothetical protein
MQNDTVAHDTALNMPAGAMILGADHAVPL